MNATPIDVVISDNPRAPIATVAIAFALFWTTLLIHEAAHYGAAAFTGAQAELANGRWSPKLQVIVSSAGPFATLAMILGSALLGTRPRFERHLAILFSLALGAASRIALIAPATLLGRGWNDERSIVASLGISARFLVAGEALVALVALVYMAIYMRRKRRSLTLLHIIGGVGVGWASAFTFGRAIGLPI